MDLILGTLFLASAAVVFAWACVQYRRPDPGSWTASDALSNLIALLSVSAFAFGIAFIAHFAATVGEAPPGLVHIGVALAIAAAAAAALGALRARWRRLSAGAGGAVGKPGVRLAAVGAPANDTGPDLPPKAGPSGGKGRPRRRKAA